MVLVVVVFVVTRAVDTVGALVAIIYLVAVQNVVKVQSLTVVSFAKQNLTQDVLYQVNLAFVFPVHPVLGFLVPDPSLASVKLVD